MRNWLLPEYIEDILPPEALRIEHLRRRLLDLFQVHGYQLVMPPLLEYMQSLLTGTGHDMELRTFQVVDQLSGRLMGIREDITPQVARIDAHLLNREGLTRLCYAGSVLHTLPAGYTGTREPLQTGAELYGHSGIESDVEIQQLMLKSLELSGVKEVHLDIGHVAIFRSLVKHGSVNEEQESALFQALQSKDVPTIREVAADLSEKTRNALLLLPELYGGVEVLEKARHELPDYPEITQALNDLSTMAVQLQGMVEPCFDLAELRGYHYHSGVVFAVYSKGSANAIALGGRYDEVGKAFGRARPATGFSMDLRQIAGLTAAVPLPASILAPYMQDIALQGKINALRAQGEVVVVDLPGHGECQADLNCDRKLVLVKGVWEIEKV